MQRFIVQIPGEFDAIEAGALAAKLKELDIEVFLQDAQMTAAPEKSKRRAKSSEPCASIQWSQDPILYAKQRAAVNYVLARMQLGRITTVSQIKRWTREHGQWQSATPCVTLACRDGLMERKHRGRYMLTEKGAKSISSVRVAS